MLNPEGQVNLPVDGRPSRSNYKVLRRFQSELEPTAFLVELKTLTGRKHQVRVHAAQGLGAPVILDSAYGNGNSSSELIQEQVFDASTKPGRALNRFFLHASSLSVPALNVYVNSALPEWWKPALALLEGTTDGEQETEC